MKYIGFFKCSARIEDLINKSLELEKKNVFVQHYPCRLVLSEDMLPITARIAIMDFKLGYNKAKKISIQFLLRISGINQIQKAFNTVFKKEIDAFYIIVFTEDPNVSLNEIMEEYSNICFSSNNCVGDINEIKKLYNILEDEIKASQRPHETEMELLKKIILERVSTKFLLK